MTVYEGGRMANKYQILGVEFIYVTFPILSQKRNTFDALEYIYQYLNIYFDVIHIKFTYIFIYKFYS